MHESIVQPWWVPGLRGLIAVAFGLLTLTWPGLTLVTLLVLFAAYALLGGAVSVLGAARNRRDEDNRWLLLLLGLASLGVGVVAILHPALTALVLVLLIGANALVTGVLDIAAAIRLRKVIQGEWLLGFSGAMSVLFGGLIFLSPGAGMLALLWLIGIYALVTGGLLMAVAFRLRSQGRDEPLQAERRVTPDRRVSPAH